VWRFHSSWQQGHWDENKIVLPFLLGIVATKTQNIVVLIWTTSGGLVLFAPFSPHRLVCPPRSVSPDVCSLACAGCGVRGVRDVCCLCLVLFARRTARLVVLGWTFVFFLLLARACASLCALARLGLAPPSP
jgi:hypothetical protein